MLALLPPIGEKFQLPCVVCSYCALCFLCGVKNDMYPTGGAGSGSTTHAALFMWALPSALRPAYFLCVREQQTLCNTSKDQNKRRNRQCVMTAAVAQAPRSMAHSTSVHFNSVCCVRWTGLEVAGILPMRTCTHMFSTALSAHAHSL